MKSVNTQSSILWTKITGDILDKSRINISIILWYEIHTAIVLGVYFPLDSINRNLTL